MDNESELARAKWLLLGIVLFAVSIFIAYSEFAYLLFGHETQSTSAEIYTIDRRGRFGLVRGKKTVVEYEFTDNDGNRRKGRDEVSPDWGLSGGESVTVRYRPGATGSSRLAGHVNWLGLVLFFGITIFLCIVGFRFWRHVTKAVAEMDPKKKRRN